MKDAAKAIDDMNDAIAESDDAERAVPPGGGLRIGRRQRPMPS